MAEGASLPQALEHFSTMEGKMSSQVYQDNVHQLKLSSWQKVNYVTGQ